MQTEILSSQPQLALTPVQRDIIAAHMTDALQNIASIQFRDAQKIDQMLFYVYHQGRKDLALALINFDHDQAIAAKEAATNNSQEG